MSEINAVGMYVSGIGVGWGLATDSLAVVALFTLFAFAFVWFQAGRS